MRIADVDEPVVDTSTPAPLLDQALAAVVKRRIPRVYVIDSAGTILMRGCESRSLSAQTRKSAMNLLHRHRGTGVVQGLTASGEFIRLLPLSGNGHRHFALFVEPAGRQSPPDDAAARYGLSARERDVVEHLLRGDSTTEIAERLIIAKSTVAAHIRNIGSKMNATKRKEIVAVVLDGR